MIAVRTAACLLFCVIFLTIDVKAANTPSRKVNATTPIVNSPTLTAEDEDDDDDIPDELLCTWKWSRWSSCTKECNSGNTTRRALCYCSGLTVPVADARCSKQALPQLYDVVPCNEQGCKQASSCNKGCWLELIERNLVVNMTNGVFNCSLGCPNDSSCPKGKKYVDVLEGAIPSTENAEWYYLAKEWYAALLNKYNGVPFSTLANEALADASVLLENCIGWGPDDLKTLAYVYATKEKLNRVNNGIGGLSEVDDQISEMVNGGFSSQDDTDSESSIGTLPFTTFLILVILVPFVVLLLVVVVVVGWVYYRRRTSVVVAHAEFNDDDGENALQTPVVAHDGESGSEEKVE